MMLKKNCCIRSKFIDDNQQPTTNNQQTMASQKPDLTIIHFNDVYDTTERKVEPVGGAARLVDV